MKKINGNLDGAEKKMSDQSKLMEYRMAKNYADHCMEWLKPFCVRLEIAGSVRRGKALCGDVDLVAIPKVETVKNLFGEADAAGQKNLLKAELERYVQQNHGVKWLDGTGVTTGATVNFRLQLKKCELNVFTTMSEENFGMLWLTYTGSKESNCFLINRALSMGFQYGALRGIFDGNTWCGRTEQEIFEKLKMPWIEPCDREVHKLRRMSLPDGSMKKSK